MTGPPNGPAAFRVSATRQGVTATSRSPLDPPATAAACVTVKTAPPAVNVAVRDAVAVFASTEYVTVAVPVPLATDVMCSHEAELVMIQTAVAGLTCNCVLPVPAPAAGAAVAGEKT
jgi:hypothetical protein